MRRLTALRNLAAVLLTLCIALGGVAQATSVARVSVESGGRQAVLQPVGFRAAAAMVRQVQARNVSLHRVFFAGPASLIAIARPDVSLARAVHSRPFPRAYIAASRRGRSPPLDS